MKKIILILFLLFLTSYQTASAASKAEPIINISPLIFNISLSPGKTYNYKLEAKNLTSTPLPLKISLENFQSTDEEGGYDFANNTPNPLLSWVKIEKTDMIIPVKGKETVNFSISIPNKIPLGGYYGILFLEPLVTQKAANNTVINSRVGSLLLANIGNQGKNQPEILTFTTDRIIEGNNLNFLLRVKNNGLNHFSAKPFIYVRPLIGPSQKIEIEEKFVFPNKVRRWQEGVKLDHKWLGIYQIKVGVSSGNGDQIFATKYFIDFPVSKAILILLSASILGFIIIYRKRVIKALSILIGNKA